MPDKRLSSTLALVACFALVGVLSFTTSPSSRRLQVVGYLADALKALTVLDFRALTTNESRGNSNADSAAGVDDTSRTAAMSRQQERQLRLRAACDRGLSSAPLTPRIGRSGSSASVVAPPRARYYFFVPKLAIGYCAIPKCASTTLKGFFERISGIACGGSLREHVCADARLAADELRDGRRRFQGAPGSGLLLVVRNPWVRLVSSYVDKYVRERHKLTQSCYDRHGADRFGAPLNFSQFAQCVIGDYEAGKPLDQHIAPMHWMCDQCTMKYSYIATVETLHDDFLYLSRYVFPKSTNYSTYDREFAAGYRRPSETNNETAKAYAYAFASLSSHELDAIIRLYRPDALYYGYPERPI